MFSTEHSEAPPRGKLFDSETEADYFSKMSARNNTKTTGVLLAI
jgi:hypothetical protein